MKSSLRSGFKTKPFEPGNMLFFSCEKCIYCVWSVFYKKNTIGFILPSKPRSRWVPEVYVVKMYFCIKRKSLKKKFCLKILVTDLLMTWTFNIFLWVSQQHILSFQKFEKLYFESRFPFLGSSLLQNCKKFENLCIFRGRANPPKFVYFHM